MAGMGIVRDLMEQDGGSIGSRRIAGIPLFLGGALAEVAWLEEPGIVAAAAGPGVAGQLDQAVTRRDN